MTADDAVRRSLATVAEAFGDAPAYACELTIPSRAAAEAVALAGARIGLISAPFGDAGADLCAGLARRGASALARGSVATAPLWVAAALDAGARGVVFTGARGADDVAAALRLVRFPPHGDRPPMRDVPANAFGADQDYESAWNGDAWAFVDVSTAAAPGDVGAIGGLSGVSGLAFDPTLYAADAGWPGAADVLERLEATIAAAGDAPVMSAPFGDFGPVDLIRRGVALIVLGTDAGILRRAIARHVAAEIA